ncbi:helicase-associated domain-containing protein [Cohnella laeviribosi]|uniref:helicase-associated domain-containing protein n=1 Tax=Cohnella laeviribosi TaxID=380174 RepID=UPI00035F8343|nr:helicase-associated domain-containing protein [Cohnella laeviribosi]
MKLSETLSRLPPAIRERLEAEPLIAARLKEGRSLTQTLSDADWAREWAARADRASVETLRRIVAAYAATPFEAEKPERELASEGGLTGAEIRVALVRLRQAGIVFAVRKLWGETLLYVPADTAALWQQLLLPVQSRPLGAQEEREVRADPREFRLPLSLELLAAWSGIRRHGLPITAKGVPHKAAAARIASEMRLSEADLAPIAFALPQASVCPLPLSLALDLGLHFGVLVRRPDGFAVTEAEGAPAGWAGRTPAEADRELLEAAVCRYASQHAPLYGAAAALRALAPLRWHRESDVIAQMPEQARGGFQAWIGLMSAWGWMERGRWQAEPVFRWNINAALPSLSPSGPENGPSGEPERICVLPDLEIMVPPGVTLGCRWRLEEVAERVTADVVSAYRLTKAGCVAASRRGYGLASLTAALEELSKGPLPDSVRSTLADWFRTIGRLSLASAVLLRVRDEELADRIAADPQAVGALAERLGTTAFIVRPEAMDDLTRRLNELGYPVNVDPDGASALLGGGREDKAGGTGGRKTSGTAGGNRKSKADDAFPSVRPEAGWACRRYDLAVYEPDPLLPGRSELFPGWDGVPKTWLQKPASYHPSTKRKLIELAIAWRTALRVGNEGHLTFVPERLEGAEESWRVRGRIIRRDEVSSAAPDASGGAVALTAEECRELMIVLPSDL